MEYMRAFNHSRPSNALLSHGVQGREIEVISMMPAHTLARWSCLVGSHSFPRAGRLYRGTRIMLSRLSLPGHQASARLPCGELLPTLSRATRLSCAPRACQELVRGWPISPICSIRFWTWHCHQCRCHRPTPSVRPWAGYRRRALSRTCSSSGLLSGCCGGLPRMVFS